MREAWQALYYRMLIPLLHMGARIAATNNGKVNAALAGKRVPACSRPTKSPRLWFHASSLGEFEQAKPIIEALKERYPQQAVWVTLFSPSGYVHGMGYEHAEELFYLPMDRADLTTAFALIDPHLVVVVKADLWPGLVWAASRRRVPTILVDGTLTRNSIRNRRWARSIQKSFYSHLSGVAAVSETDARRIRRLCGSGVPITVIGDSKFDRVWSRAMRSRPLGLLDTVLAESPLPTLVAGSTHEAEERALARALDQLKNVTQRVSVVLVPHEPTESRLAQAERVFSERGWHIRRLSAVSPGEPWQMLLVDRVGILAEIYRRADIVFVGGSFTSKVHNVLEPAVFGKPIIVGPYYENSPEAASMIEHHALVSVPDADRLAETVRDWLNTPEHADVVGSAAHAFVEARLHASDRIVDYIAGWLPQTKALLEKESSPAPGAKS